MKWAFRGALAIIIIALAVWIWVTLFPGPEQAIRKRLAELAQLGSFSGNEGQLAKGLNSQKLATFFTPDVEVSVDVPGIARQKISGQDDLLKAAMAVRTYLSGLKVDLVDINITFGPGKESAIVNLTLKVQVNGEKEFTPQEMKFTLKKVKGEWLIREAETVRTLSLLLNKLNELNKLDECREVVAHRVASA